MYTLNCRGNLLSLEKPVVMGIINVTPDSFFNESRKQDVPAIVAQAQKMVNDGADILDIGGQSTRPGAQRVGQEEEMIRVVPAIGAIVQAIPDVVVSVDTFYAQVAHAAVLAGACMVNDVSGGLLDEKMLQTVASLKVPYVCMHMQGEPQNMQQNPVYQDVTKEVLDFLVRRIAACRKAGISDVIADPGLGFGKTAAHNFTLIRHWDVFKMLDVPLLMGISRKSTIYKTLGITVEEALNGTTVLHTIGLMNGAHILRVHDVKEAKEAITLYDYVQNAAVS